MPADYQERPLFAYYPCLILVFLLIVSGCVSPQQPENLTQVQTVRPQDPSGNTSSVPTVITPGISVTQIPLQEIRPRPDLNVERGKSFTITGTVNNRSVKEVQVWLVNRTLSVRRVPVMADGTFTIVLHPDDTSVLPRNFSSALVIQYPAPPDNFTVTLDESSGKVTATADVPPRILSEINDKGYYPTTLVDFLNQAIMQYGSGNTCDIYFPNGIDAWITLVPVPPGPPGTMTVAGTTSLPAGTPVSITVVTVFTHPTPQNYDYSHEIANGNTVVVSGEGGINRFSGAIDTSRLNTGRYMVSVDTGDDALQANANGFADIITTTAAVQKTGNYINWSALSLPTLVVNKTMEPVMLDGEWKIVPSGTQQKNNEVPYGAIIDCAPDEVCRIFSPAGTQILAVYYSNEAHSMEVPDGAMVDTESIGNATRIILGGKTILTKIDEVPKAGG
jgi:heat shock protein HslJ